MTGPALLIAGVALAVALAYWHDDRADLRRWKERALAAEKQLQEASSPRPRAAGRSAARLRLVEQRRAGGVR